MTTPCLWVVLSDVFGVIARWGPYEPGETEKAEQRLNEVRTDLEPDPGTTIAVVPGVREVTEEEIEVDCD